VQPDSDPYRNRVDIMTMKSLDRKLSATARLPKRSTVVESPVGNHADTLRSQRSQELGISQPHRSAPNVAQIPQAQQAHQVRQGPQPIRSQTMSPQLQREISSRGQGMRPAFARNNTGSMMEENGPPPSATSVVAPPIDKGITLADIPQLMEVAQAREQQRSLPRENAVPYIAELTPLELAIVKHCAVLALHRSPLKDQFDLEDILEMLEVKKGGFWNKLFKPQNNKSYPNKKKS
jgi:hypothetical protein